MYYGVKKKSGIMPYIVMIIVGIVIFGVGCLFNLIDYHPDWILTEATVSKITSSYDTIDDEYEYHTFVTYEVDGNTYTDVAFNVYSSSYVSGTTKVKIRYNPDDPNQIVADSSETMPIFIIIASIVSGLGLLLLIIRIVKDVSTKNRVKNIDNNVYFLPFTAPSDDEPTKTFAIEFDRVTDPTIKLTTEEGKLAYTMTPIKKSFLFAATYEFENSLHYQNTTHTVGKVSASQTTVNDRVTSSWSDFSFDNLPIRDYLSAYGVAVKMSSNGLAILLNDKQVGSINMLNGVNSTMSSNAQSWQADGVDKKSGFFGQISQGISEYRGQMFGMPFNFSITTTDSYMELCGLVALALVKIGPEQLSD